MQLLSNIRTHFSVCEPFSRAQRGREPEHELALSGFRFYMWVRGERERDFSS